MQLKKISTNFVESVAFVQQLEPLRLMFLVQTVSNFPITHQPAPYLFPFLEILPLTWPWTCGLRAAGGCLACDSNWNWMHDRFECIRIRKQVYSQQYSHWYSQLSVISTWKQLMASGAYLEGQMPFHSSSRSCWERTSPRRGATYVSEQITTGRTEVVNCAGPTRWWGGVKGRGGVEKCAELLRIRQIDQKSRWGTCFKMC